MPLPDRDIKNLVLATGLNPKAVSRLLGSIRLSLPPLKLGTGPDTELCHELTGADELSEDEIPNANDLGQFIDVGLRLDGQEVLAPLLSRHGKDLILERLAAALSEYTANCSAVATWVGRGDFSVEATPPHIGRGTLIFACRSAGRIRAKAVRT